MSNLQAEIAQYTTNEATKKSFTALYRLIKTHTLIKNLYLNQALKIDVYSREVKETLSRISMLKKEISNYDIARFCELWDITTEYEALNFQNQALASSLKVPIGVARLANLLPRLNDQVSQATKYEQIHEVLSTFSIELGKLLRSDPSISPVFKRIINDLVALESRFAQQYQRLTDLLDQQDKDLLRQGLAKFRVQFQKSYQF